MRVLVARAGALGDLLLLRGVLASLHAAGHEAALLAPAGPGEALRGDGPTNVRDLLAWDRPDLAPLHLAGGHADPGMAAALSGFDAALAFTRSAEVRENLGRVIPRVRSRDPRPLPGGPHAAAWAEALLAELDVPRVCPGIERASPPEAEAARESARGLPTAFLAVHAGSGSREKNWTSDGFLALADRLAGDAPWLLVEGPADDEASARLRTHRGVVRAHGLPLRVLGALLACAGLYVGNDSGVSHLAAAWGAPSLVLFGPTDPAQWSPVGPRVTTLRAAEGRMSGLAVDAVVTAAQLRFAAAALPSG